MCNLVLSLVLVLASVVGIGGCHREGAVSRQRLFGNSQHVTSGAGAVQSVTIGGETRDAIRLVPGVPISYVASRDGQLRFAISAVGAASGSSFPVEVAVSGPTKEQLQQLQVQATAEQKWQPVAVSRAVRTGQQITFEVPASGKGKDAGAVVLADPVLESSSPTGAPRLVVIILIDTLRADHTSLLGYHLSTTPSLQALARDGVTFLQAHTPGPWTRPAVTSLLTSLDPDQHRVVDRMDKLRDGVVTWADVARGQGFQTIAVSTNPNVLPVWGLGQGFGRFVDLESGEWVQKTADAEKVFHLAEKLLEEEHLPLFLYLHLDDPHVPYDPPVATARELFPDYSPSSPGRTVSPTDSDDVIRSAIRRYDAEIRCADKALGEFLATLRARHLYDPATIVVIGDHGEEFQDHGGVYHGKTVYEELLHVPLVIKFPEEQAGGTRVTQLVSSVDVLPTLAETLGWPMPAGITGRSLWGLIGGRPLEKMPFFASARLDGTLSYALINTGRKLIRQVRPTSETELFDLEKDPNERTPQADTPEKADMLQALKRRLALNRGGWHVAVCAGQGNQRVIMDIEDAGPAFQSVGLEDDDRTELGAGGHLHFESSVGPVTRKRESFGKLLDVVVPDEDEIVFPGPRPTLRLLPSPAGGSPQLRFADKLVPAPTTVQLDPSDWIQPVGERPLCTDAAAPTVLVWYVTPPPPKETARPDESTRERMRALGYKVD